MYFLFIFVFTVFAALKFVGVELGKVFCLEMKSFIGEYICINNLCFEFIDDRSGSAITI